MKFLVPTGSKLSDDFGVFTSPGHRKYPIGIKDGLMWGGDNEAYTGKFEINRFIKWLSDMELYRSTCLFIAVPDVVGDAQATLNSFEKYHSYFDGWPLAFVAQDGQEDLDFPPADQWDTLFIGGTTEWKLGHGAYLCIKRAQALGKKIHIGRVNRYRRYQHFASLEGSEEFTCDGTRIKFGKDTVLKEWKEYMERPRQHSFSLPHSNRLSELDHS